jgi:Ca2+-binding RTX toxin-like protein
MLITSPFRSLRSALRRSLFSGQAVASRRRRSAGVSASIEQVESRALLAAAITVGSHTLLPNTPNQTINIIATGDSDVTGINVRAQLGDGTGAGAEPVFDAISYDSSIWSSAATTITGGPIGGVEQFVQSSIVFNASGTSVVSDGQVFQLSIDTTGFTSGTFDLRLSMTEIGADTAFVIAGGAEESISITNGTITVGAVDTTPPTVTVDIVDASLNDGDNSSQVTFEFSEAVTGFDAGDVSVSGGTLSNFAAVDSDSFTATFTANDDTEATGSVTVGTDYTDDAGNAGVGGADNVAIDTRNPTVVITPDATTTGASPVVFTFQFSEAVAGFESGDVSITNGAAGTFTPVDGDTFTLEVTPSADGDVTVNVGVGAAQDAAGNDSDASSATVTFSSGGGAQPVAVTLPGAGAYEILRDGDDLVVRVAGGSELSRDVAADVSVLQVAGSSGDDIVTVLDSGTAVDTPIVFVGDDGDDRFDASLATGVVNLTGNGGDDVLFGGSANDTLNGGSGKDELVGNAGDDLVQGQGSTGDTLDGGDGNDTLNGGSGNDLIREFFAGDAVLTNATMTGRGTDTIISAERAALTGGGAAQTIDVSTFFTPGLTSVTLDGAGGNDTLLGSDGSDVLVGSGGSDRIEGNAGNDRIIGGSGADTLIGGDGDDFIKGLGGSGDRLSGGNGNDTLNGGRGVDRVIEAGDVDFTLTTTALTGLGTDVIQSIEVAELSGGESDNTIDVSAFAGFRGFTQLRGNGGNDSIIGSVMSDVINGGDGDDTLLGKEGDDTLNGEDGNDALSGFSGNDVIDGGRGFDRGFGGEGNDSLLGGNAVDTLIGGNGDDTIAGNDGTDTLVGGTGNNDAGVGDVFNDATAVIDESFQLDPLPGWVDQV